MSRQQHGELARLKRPDEIDEVLGRANPNAERIGCPSRDVLVALARRERPIGDRAYDHLAECSPCYLEVRAFKEAADLRRRRILTWGAAAALVIATCGVGWFVASQQLGTESAEVRVQLDLRPYAITRGEATTSDLPPLVLPRGRVALTLLLPTGSEPGRYDVQIRDSSGSAKASADGDARFLNRVTTLETTLQASALPPGPYQLAIRRTEEDWQVFPVQLH